MGTGVVSACLAALRSHQLVAWNACTGATLCAGSDCIAQVLEQRRAQKQKPMIDRKRVASAALIGGGFSACVYPFAYARLDSLWPGTQFLTVLKKSIFEICTVGLFVNAVSISSRGALSGRSFGEIGKHVKEEMPMVTLNDARVWLPYNIIAFTFVPAYLRPTSTAFMEASWQTYISLRSHNYQRPTATLPSPSSPLLQSSAA